VITAATTNAVTAGTSNTVTAGTSNTVTAGTSSWQFAVNLLAPEESDLSTAKNGKWGAWEKPEETRREYASVLWFFVLGALVVMVTHLFLVTHSKGRV